MDENIGNIQNLSRTILRSAEHEVQKVLSDAEEKAEEIRAAAQYECDEAYQKVVAKAVKEAEFIKNRNLAAAEAELQMKWMITRESLINQVFDQVLASLQEIVDRDDYQGIVEALLDEAIFQLNAETVLVRFDSRADHLLADAHLKKIAAKNKVSIERGEVLAEGFGVIAQTVDGHRKFDNTLQARLGRKKSKLRLPVYQLLIGEG